MKMEKFVRDQMPDVPAVTVRKNGSLSLNQKAVEEFNITEMTRASLHFDRSESLLGIRPEEDAADPSAFRVSKEKDRTRVISCQGFLKYCGIPYHNGSKVYKAEWNDEARMIVIKVS